MPLTQLPFVMPGPASECDPSVRLSLAQHVLTVVNGGPIGGSIGSCKHYPVSATLQLKCNLDWPTLRLLLCC